MKDIKLKGFTELSTNEMYSTDGGYVPILIVTVPAVCITALWWLANRK